MKIVFPTSHQLAQNNLRAAYTFSGAVLSVVDACVEAHNGVCIHLTPYNIVVCWNGHKPCLHEKSALQCASDIAVAIENDENCKHMPWLICIGGGLGVVGVTGSASQKTPVVLGTVPELVDLMGHLPSLFTRTILITDAIRDATLLSVNSRVVDVLTFLEKKTYVFEIGQDTGSEVYNTGFSALQNGRYDEAAANFLGHLRISTTQDAHAIRLFRISKYLSRTHAERGVASRDFVGWTSFEKQSENEEVPEDVPKAPASPLFRSRVSSKPPQETSLDGDRLRNHGRNNDERSS